MRSPIASHLTRRRADQKVIGVTLHCTGSNVRDGIAKWRQIQELAMGGALPSGDVYGDTPYNAGVVNNGPLAGTLLPGRDAIYLGAHARSVGAVANTNTLGVAVIGDGETLSEPAQLAIRSYLYVCTLRFGLVPYVFDHDDWNALGYSATGCPGSAISEFRDRLLRERRRRAA